MGDYLLEVLNLLARSLHVVTGIAWIGASFYFIWLDNHLVPPEDARGREAPSESRGREAPSESNAVERGVAGELWAIHGGGFYHAQKYRVAPPAIPARLHWFKWEAYSTLLSGLALLAIVYYANAGLYLVDPSLTALSPAGAIAASVAVLAGGWIVYDLLCRSPLGRNDRALGAVLAILCVAAAYGLCHLFPGRAAFLHFGAMLGTIMVLNVYFVIIPGQRRMVEAARAGRAPDPADGLRGKQRSVHNTYFTLPAVFTMISNHYAWIFGNSWAWLALVAISAAGALIRIYFVARHKGAASPWPLALATIVLATTAYALRPAASATSLTPSTQRAQSIVLARCAPCHAAAPTFAGIAAAPKGVMLEHPAQLTAQAALIRDQVRARAMPPGNLTQLTDSERSELLAWADGAARR
jgi:uncharacterized membrane protein